MKLSGTYYQTEGVSTSEIAGAIALCAIHDLRVNLFRFGGFPQIIVEQINDNFKITISAADVPVREGSFLLSKEEAFKAAKRFKDKQLGYDESIFDRVQDTLAKVVG
jgi:hypothetical protein